jgi:hypothetical protein
MLATGEAIVCAHTFRRTTRESDDRHVRSAHRPNSVSPDIFADYAIFASSEFDPNEYANTVLAGEPYPPQPGSSRPTKTTGLEPAKEDISVAIAKLNYGIDDVSKQIKNVVRLFQFADVVRD